MTITAGDYKAKFTRTANVSVSDGIEFEIRKISPIDFWDEAPKEKVPPAEFIKKVLLKGVVSPALSDGQKEGALAVQDLEFEHANKLVDEILKFSGYKTEDGKTADFLSQSGKG